jgi:hypothetical protein
MKLLLRASTVLLAATCLTVTDGRSGAADGIHSGDLLIANGDVAVRGNAGIVAVDPVTGAQRIVSKGGLFAEPDDVVVGPSGKLFVVDSTQSGGSIVSFDPVTGTQAILASGGLFAIPFGIAVEANGQLLVSQINTFTFGCSIVRVDPDTGAQSCVARLPARLSRVAVEPDGQILAAVLTPGAEILRVDPNTGTSSVVTEGGLLTKVFDLGIASNGEIIVLNQYPMIVVAVDPVSGAQTLISRGLHIEFPFGLAVGSDDAIFVVEPEFSTGKANGKVLRIDRVTGAQSIVTEGGRLVDPYGITVVP